MMYPGIACNKKIPIHKTKIEYFNQTEDFAITASLLTPLVNIGENKEDYIITITTPGFHRDDIYIESNNSVLRIAGKKEVQNEEYTIDRCEYNLSEWTRAFQLPNDADIILAHAEFIDGEIIIHIPRYETIENKGESIIHLY